MTYLSDSEIEALLLGKWEKVIRAVEGAFLDPTASMVPKIYLQAGSAGDYRAMPAAMGGYAAIKWIGVFPDNRKHNLPTTIGSLILNDRYTGRPLITMDCSALTAYRTAATSAIAAKYCAPKAKEFAFVGCGKQTRYHIEAYKAIYGELASIKIYDRSEEAMISTDSWIGENQMAVSHGVSRSLIKVFEKADVVTTLTPSTEAYLDVNWLKNNCHINAIGADAKGKRELMANVFDWSTNIICDDPEQAFHSGELQHNTWPDLKVHTLSHVIQNHNNMKFDSGISVFDSTGVALEDVAIGTLIYQLNFS